MQVCLLQGGHKFGGRKFKDFQLPFLTYSSNVLPHQCLWHHIKNISSTNAIPCIYNHRYIAVLLQQNHLVFSKLLYIIQGNSEVLKFEDFSRTFYIKFHSFSRPYGVFKNSPGPGKWILFSRTFKEMWPPCCYHVLAICALTYLVIICAVIHVERFKFTIVYFCLWFLYQFF